MSLSFVFDSSVVVSASLFSTSVPRQALDRARFNGNILLSQAVIDKFDSYVKKEKRIQFLEALIDEAHLIEPTVSFSICRDPEDNKYLELAVTAGATCIVSGDNDLLVLHPFQNIPIVNPATFLATEWKDED
ncbi:MAG TPA: putative toxin-antitoxin system toxin component, PIN family [Aggregatilineales bacterium]|nr:putative toxin-antitoxin system toxin component, PIN family [Aggregatilineales bacterium]